MPLVTVLLFIAIGVGVGRRRRTALAFAAAVLGADCRLRVALIFYLRMRIEDLAGKAASQQASLGGFETEDVLYLLPLGDAVQRARAVPAGGRAVGAPLFAVWVVFDYRRASRRAGTGADERRR